MDSIPKRNQRPESDSTVIPFLSTYNVSIISRNWMIHYIVFPESVLPAPPPSPYSVLGMLYKENPFSFRKVAPTVDPYTSLFELSAQYC